MDEQSTTPVSDFLQNLNAKVHAAVKVDDPPSGSRAQGDDGKQPADTSQRPADGQTQSAPATDQRPPAAESAEANKSKIIVKALKAIEQNIANIIRLLEEKETAPGAAMPQAEVDPALLREAELAGVRQVDGRVIEGVFDGQGMVGSDGKSYTVPPNYASKSKLVEGDLLKLTITQKGSFIYKQIGPIERSRVVATLGFDATTGEWYATTDSKRWSLLKASVTYFKGEPGDEVVLLTPKNAPSKWGAVENIIKKNPLV